MPCGPGGGAFVEPWGISFTKPESSRIKNENVTQAILDNLKKSKKRKNPSNECMLPFCMTFLSDLPF